jgi:hypothetical protein
VTVTSPDSTGSDNGVGGAGYVQQHAYPGSTATDNTALGSCTFHLYLSLSCICDRGLLLTRPFFGKAVFISCFSTNHPPPYQISMTTH